jgi:hypothetical protein
VNSILRVDLVEPIRRELRPAFVDYSDGSGELRNVLFPVYPKPSMSLREMRRSRGLSLGDTAALLGVTVSVVSGLEFGKYAPVDGWSRVVELLDGGAK